MMRYRKLLPHVATLLLAGMPCSFADQVVYFVNGKAIMVKSVEKGEKFTVLEMEGGGRIGVPTEQISKIEDYVVSEPVAAQPAPPQVAAVPALPVQAGGPAVPLPQQTVIPGPGIGGRPSGGPGQNLAGLQPLEIGKNGGPAAAQRPPNRPGALNGGPGVQMLNPGAVRPKSPGAPNRPGGRGAYFAGAGAGARRGRALEMYRNAPPPGASSAPPPAVNTAPPVAQAPPTVNEPEGPPPPPDDPNEAPSDPSAPEEGDSSGNTPGGPS